MRNTPPPTRRVRSVEESKSATVRAAAAAPSRRQQSKWQREQHQQHILLIAVGVLVALVVAVFAAGFVYDNIVRANSVVAQVGADGITATDLVNAMKPSARSIDAQAQQSGRTGLQLTQYVDQKKKAFPDQSHNNLIDQNMIQQEANLIGIAVSAT